MFINENQQYFKNKIHEVFNFKLIVTFYDNDNELKRGGNRLIQYLL